MKSWLKFTLQTANKQVFYNVLMPNTRENAAGKLLHTTGRLLYIVGFDLYTTNEALRRKQFFSGKIPRLMIQAGQKIAESFFRRF